MSETKRFVRPAEPWEFVPENYFGTVDLKLEFGNDHPVEIDLGCGDGKFVLEMAKEYPERNFLAVERLLGRVRKVCRGADRLGLTNLRVLRLETLYTLEWLLADQSASRLHLLCPDPWPKAKHHRRRLFQSPFLNAARRVLKPDGELLFKTDHDEYFEWAEEQLDAFQGFQRLAWQEGDFFYPKTDFQIQWEAEGKVVQGMRLRKI